MPARHRHLSASGSISRQQMNSDASRAAANNPSRWRRRRFLNSGIKIDARGAAGQALLCVIGRRLLRHHRRGIANAERGFRLLIIATES